MLVRPPLPEGPLLVVGLARSGVAALRLLRDRGISARGVDAGSPAGIPSDLDVTLETDGLALLDGVTGVLKSPGVPAQVPVIAAARARGIPVFGELEVAWRALGREFWAVTGTNGKTTTVELLGAMVRAAGREVTVAGNVGCPLSTLVGTLADDAIVVCEASSFQLEDAIEFAPEAAALLNLEPDHLDRHGTMAAYRAAKLAIFAKQGPRDSAVLPTGFSTEGLGGDGTRIWVGPGGDLDDREGQLWWRGEPLVQHVEIGIRGAHNRSNAAMAAAIALDRGLPLAAVRDGLRRFTGVEHRLERFATIDGVTFINDSKATNVASTLVALQAMDDDAEGGGAVHLILGGVGKDQNFAPLRAATAGCAAVYLIGRDAPLIAQHVDGEIAEDLTHALDAARARARVGDTILLSPACASFDQFADFEARGRAFKELVLARRISS